MDSIGAWKHKLEEAMAVFRDMSQIAKLEAHSYWKDVETLMFNSSETSSILDEDQQSTPMKNRGQSQSPPSNYRPETTIDIETDDSLFALISDMDNMPDSVPMLSTYDTLRNIDDGMRGFSVENNHDFSATPDDPTLGLSLILHGEPIQKQQVATGNCRTSILCSNASQSSQVNNRLERDYMDTMSDSHVTGYLFSSKSLEATETTLRQTNSNPPSDDHIPILYDSSSAAVPFTGEFYYDESLNRDFKTTDMDNVEVKESSVHLERQPSTNIFFDSSKNEYDDLQQVHQPQNILSLEPGNFKADSGYVDQQYSCSEYLTQTFTDYALTKQQTSESGGLPMTKNPTPTAITQSQTHTCDICQKTGFSSRGNLKRHRDKHSGEKPHKCEICAASFSEKKNLRIHFRIHSGEKPHKCDICHRAFAQSIVLKNHMTTHLNERRFACTRCDKSFKLKGELRKHIMRHEGVRRFQCSICQAAFFAKADLGRHMRTHTGERPFACDLCDKRFKRQQLLNEHRNRHFGKNPYNCEYCPKSFPELSAFRKHIKQHDKDKISCESITNC